MKKIYQFLLSIIIISVLIFLALYSYFGVILWNKYRHLWKIVRRMENDKYLWPISNNISKKIIKNINLDGETLLIGVGNCGILEELIKKNVKVTVIDSNNYLLDIAKDKFKDCEYYNENFEEYVTDKRFSNVISTLPHKEFSLREIELFFNKYFSLTKENLIFFESKIPHVKNTYNKLIINNLNQTLKNGKFDYQVIKKVKNLIPINLCICRFIQNEEQQPQTS